MQVACVWTSGSRIPSGVPCRYPTCRRERGIKGGKEIRYGGKEEENRDISQDVAVQLHTDRLRALIIIVVMVRETFQS